MEVTGVSDPPTARPLFAHITYVTVNITPGWAQDAPGSSGGRSAPGGVADSRGGEEPAWTDKGEGDASGKHQTPAENPAWLKPMEHIVKPAPLPEDGSLPVEWVYMRVANVIGVILMFLTGFVEFIAGATLTTAILALYGPGILRC